jgi:hypothetical protein
MVLIIAVASSVGVLLVAMTFMYYIVKLRRKSGKVASLAEDVQPKRRLGGSSDLVDEMPLGETECVDTHVSCMCACEWCMYACEWCIYAYRIGVYVLKLCHY